MVEAVSNQKMHKKLLAHLSMPLFRNGYALLLSGLASSGLGLLYWLVAARLYPSSVVGENSAAISAMMLISGISQLSLNNIYLRFVPMAGKATTRLVAYTYLISIVATIFFGLIFYWGADRWAASFKFLVASPSSMALFILSTAAWTIFSLQDSVLTSLRKTMWVPIENILVAIGKIGLLFLPLALVPRYTLFLAWSIPVAISILPISYLLFAHSIPSHEAISNNNASSLSPYLILQYLISTYFGSLLMLAANMLIPILVASQVSAATNAFFYIPWMLSTGLRLIALNLTTSLTVEAVHDDVKLAIYCYRVLLQCLRLTVPIVTVIVIGAPMILHLFGQEYAKEGTTLLRLLILSALPNIFVMIYFSLARVQDRIWGLFFVQGMATILLLTMSYLLLPGWGLTGIGIASLASQSIMAIWVLYMQLGQTLRNGRKALIYTGNKGIEMGNGAA